MTDLPVVAVGAGPVGLAAAAELRERGIDVVVLERGAHAGAAIAQWNHVRLFSRWAELIAPAARRLLDHGDWNAPADEDYPTGQDWVRDYLLPLSEALGDTVRYDTEVVRRKEGKSFAAGK